MATILIIEDNDDLRSVLVSLLTRLGCDACGAASGRAGLIALLGGGIDLVITDWMLGDVTGGTVLAAADAAGVLAGVPVIIYSSSIDAVEPAALVRSVLVPKSSDIKTLLGCVARLLPGTAGLDRFAPAPPRQSRGPSVTT
jgi:CheY-like chemotaxis protein